MRTADNLIAITDELAADARCVDQDQIDTVVNRLMSARRVFVGGAGRSGFAARAFSNRLMHLGFDVHFITEPTCPSIRAGDILVLGSGSGRTASIVTAAKKAKSEGASLVTVTLNPESEIARSADAVIVLSGSSSHMGTQAAGEKKSPSIQPRGSSFEQLSWLTYDSMVVDLKRLTEQTQEQMDFRHANVE